MWHVGGHSYRIDSEICDWTSANLIFNPKIDVQHKPSPPSIFNRVPTCYIVTLRKHCSTTKGKLTLANTLHNTDVKKKLYWWCSVLNTSKTHYTILMQKKLIVAFWKLHFNSFGWSLISLVLPVVPMINSVMLEESFGWLVVSATSAMLRVKRSKMWKSINIKININIILKDKHKVQRGNWMDGGVFQLTGNER